MFSDSWSRGPSGKRRHRGRCCRVWLCPHNVVVVEEENGLEFLRMEMMRFEIWWWSMWAWGAEEQHQIPFSVTWSLERMDGTYWDGKTSRRRRFWDLSVKIPAEMRIRCPSSCPTVHGYETHRNIFYRSDKLAAISRYWSTRVSHLYSPQHPCLQLVMHKLPQSPLPLLYSSPAIFSSGPCLLCPSFHP